MQQSQLSALFLLLASPLAYAASLPSTQSSTGPSTASSSVKDEVKVTWIFPQPGGDYVWSTQTFLPTTYSGFATLSTTITTSTIVTVQDSATTQLSTYNYLIGPKGVGWSIPSTTQSGTIALLPVPTYLPGQKPVDQ